MFPCRIVVIKYGLQIHAVIGHQNFTAAVKQLWSRWAKYLRARSGHGRYARTRRQLEMEQVSFLVGRRRTLQLLLTSNLSGWASVIQVLPFTCLTQPLSLLGNWLSSYFFLFIFCSCKQKSEHPMDIIFLCVW